AGRWGAGAGGATRPAPVRPCFRALARDLALPAAVTGPVECWELARRAASSAGLSGRFGGGGAAVGVQSIGAIPDEPGGDGSGRRRRRGRRCSARHLISS